jgi:hypothetical protein
MRIGAEVSQPGRDDGSVPVVGCEIGRVQLHTLWFVTNRKL